MIKFCKIEDRFVICDDNTIKKFNLTVEKEITEEEYSKLGEVYTTKNGELVFEREEEEVLLEEYNNLISWFEEYDNQIKQYERCQRLGEVFDKDIKQLDAQAKINQKRVRELRERLKKVGDVR